MKKLSTVNKLEGNFQKLSKKWESLDNLQKLVDNSKIGKYDLEVLTNMVNSPNEVDNYIASHAISMRVSGLIQDEVS